MIPRKLFIVRRRATAAVEMAVVTPLLLTLLFGIIEYGWMFTIQQQLVTAAREGARTASLPGSTVADVEGRVDQCLAPTGVHGVDVQVPTDNNGKPTGEVNLSVPYANVSLLGGYFGPTNFNLVAHSTMRKEGTD